MQLCPFRVIGRTRERFKTMKREYISLYWIGAGCVAIAFSIVVLPSVPSQDDVYVGRMLREARSADLLPKRSQDVRVICFFDVECPWCAKNVPEYVDILRSRQQEHHGVNISFELRHYPLDVKCNPLGTTPRATMACEGAVVLEAVADRYGPGKTLSAAMAVMRATPKSRSLMARIVNIDEEWITANHQRLLEKVNADIDLGLSHGVLGTPAVVVNGLRLRSPTPKVFGAVLDREIERITQPR